MGEINRLADVYNWNITRIADAFGFDRGTVRRRLKEAGVVPAGSRTGVSVYALKDVGPALYGAAVLSPCMGPDEMLPTDRKAWYQSENERVKLEKEMRLLVPVEEVHREMSRMAKAVIGTLDKLPDVLERDAGLPPEAIELTISVIDAQREQMHRLALDDDSDDE